MIFVLLLLRVRSIYVVISMAWLVVAFHPFPFVQQSIGSVQKRKNLIGTMKPTKIVRGGPAHKERYPCGPAVAR